jgi:hypothetical protein
LSVRYDRPTVDVLLVAVQVGSIGAAAGSHVGDALESLLEKER